MNSQASMAMRIKFLEALNEQLRLEAVQQPAPKEPAGSSFWPVYLVSGLMSVSLWTLSWIA